jgi:hypothetical protein
VTVNRNETKASLDRESSESLFWVARFGVEVTLWIWKILVVILRRSKYY